MEDELEKLIKACEDGNLEKVKYFIRKVLDINAQGSNGLTALISASKEGHLEIVKYLINNKADINSQDICKWTALMWASMGGYSEIVKHLVEKDADINIKNNDGNTALILALKEKQIDIFKYLICKDADINIKNNNGDTALILASNVRDNNDRCIINSILINATSHKSNTILSGEDLKTIAVLMKNGLTFKNSNCGMGFGTHDIKYEFNTSNITIHIRNKKTKEEQHLEYNKDDIEKGI